MKLHVGPVVVDLAARITEADFENIRTLDARDLEVVIAEASRLLSERGDVERHAAQVVIYASMLRGQPVLWTPAMVDAITETIGEHPVEAVLLAFALGAQSPGAAQDVLDRVYATEPDLIARLLSLSTYVDGAARRTMLTRAVSDPRDELRTGLFAFLMRHKRLVPPGKLDVPVPADDVMAVLPAALRDPLAEIRHRAIAVAFGLNRVAEVRDDVMRLTDDPELDVRQYALGALGTLDDAASLALLRERLRTGTEREVVSSVTGLMRRPDGLPDVLAALPDPRPWFTEHALAALRDVASPLDDGQLAALRGRVVHPALESSIAHHLWRTRAADGREIGPDDMIVRYQ